MPNPKYIKGRKKEYSIVKREKEKGRLAFRTAGSHSPIDVISIDTNTKIIRLIQSKTNITNKEKDKLSNNNIKLNGLFNCIFIIEC